MSKDYKLSFGEAEGPIHLNIYKLQAQCSHVRFMVPH